MSKIERLFEWIKENGGSLNPSLRYSEETKLYISDKIGAPGVYLFKMPKKLCIDDGIYKNFRSPYDVTFTEEEKEVFNQPFFKVILNLVSEKLKGKESFYYPFLSSLPKMEDMIKSPIFLYSSQKELWKTILPSVIVKLDNLNEFYVNLYKVIKKIQIFENIDMKKFPPRFETKDEILKTLTLWAFLIVNSYAVDKKYLLPLYNLMHYNHETQNQIVFIEQSNSLNLSYNSIDNQQIIINNGILDNESLFVIYGYMNLNEKKFLEIKLSNNYSLDDDKEVIEKVKYTFEHWFDRNIQKYYITEDVPSVSLVQYLRIISLSSKDIKLLDPEDDKYFTQLISMDNESEVYQKLLKIVLIKFEQLRELNDKIVKDDKDDVLILKKILQEQKNILKSMYYEIHKKWIGIMDTELDEKLMKDLFKLD